MKTSVKVLQNHDDVVTYEVLAKSIVAISEGFAKCTKSGLKERALVCLLHDSCGVSNRDIRAVLASLETLKQDYTK